MAARGQYPAIGTNAVPGKAIWPLKPGTYEIRLLVGDNYRSVASSSSFKIVKP